MVETAEMAEARRQAAVDFFHTFPYAQALGIRLVRIGDGELTMEMDWRDDLVGDPHTGVLHGGVISGLMDTCCGTAVVSHPQASFPAATIDLRIDYMRPATPRQRITCKATCYHVTRSIAFLRAWAWDEDDTNPVATATGAFTFGG